MESKFLIIILGSALINYALRFLPIALHTGKKPNKFLRSFLEYIPYAALGAMLFPDILYSTGNPVTSLIAMIFAAALILTKQNMVIIVSGTIFLVYLLNSSL